MIRHIPDMARSHERWLNEDRGAWTYCGRLVAWERCIVISRDNLEDAECKACQRSDDRRAREGNQ